MGYTQNRMKEARENGIDLEEHRKKAINTISKTPAQAKRDAALGFALLFLGVTIYFLGNHQWQSSLVSIVISMYFLFRCYIFQNKAKDESLESMQDVN